jgi:tyrosyl-tRNA synthetase
MTESALLDDLDARGLVQDCIDRPALAARLDEGPLSLYYGCDPTADSLHIGNLLGLLVLRRFQEAGHRPIALAGGATGMVGDPGGRSEERNLLDEDTLGANVAAIKSQIGRVFDHSGGADDWLLVDNRDWTAEVRLIDFLRDVGKHVTVNTMMNRDSVKNRLASERGISFTEFSYMLLQANDFLRLEASHGCQLQIGGSDQWGNMLGGVNLIRRVSQRPAWALAWPLLTAADGTKLGKTTGARVWLDPERTSPYAFFQHWMQTDDRQLRAFLAQFTLLPVEEIDAAVEASAADPGRRSGQRLLAEEVTGLVHGTAAVRLCAEVSGILFSGDVVRARPAALAAVAREVPTVLMTTDELAAGLDLAELLARAGTVVASRGEARRAISQGGVSVNGQRVEEHRQVTKSDLLHEQWVLLRKGKRSYVLAQVVR